MKYRSRGFTIVELLVVIVVIGILASITAISYTGVTNKALVASLVSDLNKASTILKMDHAINGNFPATLELANDGSGIIASGGATYSYEVNNTNDPKTFCITVSKNSLNYKITNDSAPVLGMCPRFGLIMDLDAGNLNSYSGSGVDWLDLSGNGSNGTLQNGVTYSADGGGSFSFDGINDSVLLPYGNQYDIREAITMMIWIKRTSDFNQLRDVMILGRPPAWYFYDAYNSGSIRGDLYIDGTRRAGINTPVPFDGSWYQIVYTYDSSTRTAKSYRNGVLSGTITLSGLSNYLIDLSDVNFRPMGQNDAGRTINLNGARIYNRALTLEEIQHDFNNSRARYGL